MWTDFEGGRLPVPDLANLAIYHDIGKELDLEAMEHVGDEAYHALYREKLVAWNAVYPVAPDERLWRGPGARG